jgi:hypothetical protein
LEKKKQVRRMESNNTKKPRRKITEEWHETVTGTMA